MVPTFVAAPDPTLLAVIYKLESIRSEENYAAYIRNGGFERFSDRTEAQLAQLGKEVCEREGIPVDEAFDEGWTRRARISQGPDIEGWY